MTTDPILEDSTPPTNAWLWHQMDRGRAAALWDELSTWVQWLRETYQFPQGQFPACWYRHSAVREELTALMAAHKAAYAANAAPDAYRSDMTAWHTHELWPVMNRLKAIGGFSECATDTCRYKFRPVPAVPGLEEFIVEDLADRPDPPASPPKSPAPLHAVGGDFDAAVAGIPVRDMESALAADLAELVDPGSPYGPVRFEDRIWEYSTAAKKYLPLSDFPDSN